MQSGAPGNSLRSDNPCAPLNNSSPTSKIFHQIPPKSQSPHPLSPRTRFKHPLRFLRISCRKCHCLNRLKREVGAAWRLSITKVFRPRLLFLAAIYSLASGLKSPENSPISRKILRGWRRPSPSSIPAEYVLAKELFSDVLPKDVSELYSFIAELDFGLSAGCVHIMNLL